MKKFLKVTVNGASYDVVVEDSNELKEPTQPILDTTPVIEKKSEVVSAPEKPGDIKVLAPMPGNIWKIKTSVGAKVEKHEVLLILEAMKMENEIVAPEAGVITSILVKEGDAVEPGKVMIEMQ